MSCLALSQQQLSQFDRPLSQHGMSEGSQPSFGRGAQIGAGGSGESALLNTSERQEPSQHDDADEASPTLLKAHTTLAKKEAVDADKSKGIRAKSTLVPYGSPKRATARVRQCAASRSEQSPAAAAETEDALELVQGAEDLEAEASRAPGSAPQHTTGEEGAGMSSGEKRPREGEGVQQDGIDAQVESHRRGAEESSKVYHNLLAKRQRLKREMEGAKNLEKNRRDLLKKSEQDKATQADMERDLCAATVAMEEAEKKVWAAELAKRKQASLSIALEAEMQEVVREQKESNERLKVHTEEFNVLLAKNNTSA